MECIIIIYLHLSDAASYVKAARIKTLSRLAFLRPTSLSWLNRHHCYHHHSSQVRIDHIVLINSVECTENTRPVLSVWKQEKHPFNGLHRLWLRRWGQKFWRPWPTPANFGHISKVFRHKLDKSAVDEENVFQQICYPIPMKAKMRQCLGLNAVAKSRSIGRLQEHQAYFQNGPLPSYTQRS